MTDNFDASQTGPACQQRDLVTEADLDKLVALHSGIAESHADSIRGPDNMGALDHRKTVDTLTALRAERDAMAADIANLTASLAGEVEEVDRLRGERDELRAAIFGSDNYCKTLCNGNFVEMAAATEAGRKGAVARAEAAEARALAAEAAALDPVKIKPLVWAKDAASFIWTAAAYQIRDEGDGYDVDFCGQNLAFIGHNSCPLPLAEAKRTAQDHHEAYIRAALAEGGEA